MEAQRKHDLSDIKFYISNKTGSRVRSVFCYNKAFRYDTPINPKSHPQISIYTLYGP